MQNEQLTGRIIGCALKVHNALGQGFVEKVYENAMAIEARKIGLKVVQQAPIIVLYDDEIIGEYFADLLIEDKVIVELKAARSITDVHEAQLLNYLIQV